MKKILCTLVMAAMAMSLMAVPARRGWQTMTQPDGTTIRVELRGDEFYHYWVDENGNQVKQNDEGYWQVVGAAPTGSQVAARRMASPMYKSGKPRLSAGDHNLAPKGLIILVNFKDKSFASGNTLAAMTELANGDNYTYNGAVGSVRKYFRDQSNGQYVPTFDVIGPVTLTNDYAYYGQPTSEDNDRYPGDMIVEACKLADSNFGVDFTQYDNDRDGEVDFVYVIYAGQGQADGGDDNTIWPHNWSIDGAAYWGNTTYSYPSQCKVDGKTINNYACSAELKGSGKRSGIGTLCHEFGHVLGLPDYYDTNDDGDKPKTPWEWSIMDYGSYNGDGNCPPNYSIFDKYYFGWATPKILNAPANITLTTGYNDAYQINDAGSLAAYTSTSVQYYIENRQQQGWDKELPGHGMIVWKVTYNASRWQHNTPNDIEGSECYTIVPAGGSYPLGNASDPFPGTRNKTSYTPFSQYPLLNITESSGNVSFIFMESPSCHNVVTNGTNCEIRPSESCVPNGTTLTANIDPQDASYDITSVSVKRGSTTLTSGTHYTLENNNTFLTIKGTAISGDASDNITITANAVKNRWSYAVALEHAILSGDEEGTVAKGGRLELSITPEGGYLLNSAENFEVEMGDATLVYGTDYTYSDGKLVINNVTGDVAVYVFGTLDPDNQYVFVPVTDVAMLSAGAKVIMVGTKTTQTYVAGMLNTNYLSAESEGFDVVNNEITIPKTTSTISIFSLGGSTGAWTLTDQNSKQLSGSADALNYASKTWTIAIEVSKSATIKAGGSYQLYFNSSSPRFRTYTSAQASLKLYIEKSTLSKQTTTITFAKTGKQTIKENGGIVNRATSNYGTPVYSSTNTGVATVDQSGNVTAVSVGTTTIKASVSETSYYTAAEASYELEVVALANYTQTWKNADVTFTTTSVREGETLALPTSSPAACSNGKVFVGWIAAADYPYSNETTAPTFVQDGAEVDGAKTYYAVFAVQKGGETQSGEVEKSSFSSVSGNLDEHISYSTAKNSGTSEPQINNNEIRLYQNGSGNGGSITLQAEYGYTITSFSITSSMATTLGFSYGGTQSVSANEKYTKTGLSTDEVTIQCKGTTSESRLYVCYLSVTYSGGSSSSYTFYQSDCSGEVKPEAVDPTFSFANGAKAMKIGDVYTNTLTNTSDGTVTYRSTDATVASVTNSGEVTAHKVGTAQITASVSGTDTYNPASASYNVTVSRKIATTSFASATAEVRINETYTQTVTTNAVGATISYSSDASDKVEVDASTGQVTGLATGTAVIKARVAQTAEYEESQATYTITVKDAAKPEGTIKVTWMADGEELTDVRAQYLYYEGEQLQMPNTTPDDCNGKQFVGWTSQNNYFHPSQAPADLFTEAGDKTVTGPVTYYAVFK